MKWQDTPADAVTLRVIYERPAERDTCEDSANTPGLVETEGPEAQALPSGPTPLVLSLDVGKSASVDSLSKNGFYKHADAGGHVVNHVPDGYCSQLRCEGDVGNDSIMPCCSDRQRHGKNFDPLSYASPSRNFPALLPQRILQGRGQAQFRFHSCFIGRSADKQEQECPCFGELLVPRRRGELSHNAKPFRLRAG